MKINSSRLQSHFEAMSLIGKIGETGTCRPAHTELEKQGFEIAASWMKEDGLMIYDKVAEIIEQVKEGDFNYKLQLPSGEKIVRTIAKPVLDDSGKVVAVFGSVIDITEQVRSEQNLQLNEKRLNEAQLLGKMGACWPCL